MSFIGNLTDILTEDAPTKADSKRGKQVKNIGVELEFASNTHLTSKIRELNQEAKGKTFAGAPLRFVGQANYGVAAAMSDGGIQRMWVVTEDSTAAKERDEDSYHDEYFELPEEILSAAMKAYDQWIDEYKSDTSYLEDEYHSQIQRGMIDAFNETTQEMIDHIQDTVEDMPEGERQDWWQKVHALDTHVGLAWLEDAFEKDQMEDSEIIRRLAQMREQGDIETDYLYDLAELVGMGELDRGDIDDDDEFGAFPDPDEALDWAVARAEREKESDAEDHAERAREATPHVIDAVGGTGDRYDPHEESEVARRAREHLGYSADWDDVQRYFEDVLTYAYSNDDLPLDPPDDPNSGQYGIELVSPRFAATDGNLASAHNVMQMVLEAYNGVTHPGAGLHVHFGLHRGLKRHDLAAMTYNFASQEGEMERAGQREIYDNDYLDNMEEEAEELRTNISLIMEQHKQGGVDHMMGHSEELHDALTKFSSTARSDKYKFFNTSKRNTVEVRIGSSEVVDSKRGWVNFASYIRNLINKSIGQNGMVVRTFEGEDVRITYDSKGNATLFDEQGKKVATTFTEDDDKTKEDDHNAWGFNRDENTDIDYIQKKIGRVLKGGVKNERMLDALRGRLRTIFDDNKQEIEKAIEQAEHANSVPPGGLSGAERNRYTSMADVLANFYSYLMRGVDANEHHRMRNDPTGFLRWISGKWKPSAYREERISQSLAQNRQDRRNNIATRRQFRQMQANPKGMSDFERRDLTRRHEDLVGPRGQATQRSYRRNSRALKKELANIRKGKLDAKLSKAFESLRIGLRVIVG